MKKKQQENMVSDQSLVEDLRKGDKEAFKQLFVDFYHDLHSFARHITQSNTQAKDIVQEVFLKLWRNRKAWKVHSSLKAYLFQSVRNEALNNIDHEQYRRNTRESFAVEERQSTVGWINNKKEDDQVLLSKIWSIVSEMPDRRRSVFVLHRKHGLSYKEIAKVLEISRKTVENHMGLALKDIRNHLDVDKF